LARAKPQILPNRFRHPAPALVPAQILDIAAISKVPFGTAAGFFGRHAALDVFFGALIDVELPFFGDFVMNGVSTP
jgi:hypothetical protein